MTTKTFTAYTAWPALEEIAYCMGFKGLNPEFISAVIQDQRCPGGGIESMARVCGVNEDEALRQYRDFLNGMRALFAPAR